MRPDIDSPSRRATRKECDLAEMMVDLVRAGDLERAQGCRDHLKVVSAERSVLAEREHEAAREARCP